MLVGTVSAAFSVLMRLSLRLSAERSDRDDLLGEYLDDPMRLFIPARMVLAIIYVVAGALLARVIAMQAGHGLPTLIAAMAVFALVCEHLIPLVLIRRDPEGVLSATLPAFHAVERLLRPLTYALLRAGRPKTALAVAAEANGAASANGSEVDVSVEGQNAADASTDADRALLRSIVDFRETLVREVMTPRPDIVAIDVSASIEALRQLFREQQYSRVPVYDGTLDNILGFAFVKDLVRQPDEAPPSLARAAAAGPLRARDQEGAGAARGVPARPRAERHRRRRVRRHRRPGHARGSARGDCRRNPRRVRRRGRADRRRGPGRVRRQRQGRRLGAGAAVRHRASSGPDSTRSAATCWRRSAACPTKGERVDVDGLAVEVLDAEHRRVTRVRVYKRAPAEAESPAS